MTVDFVIVGSGFFGATVAERLAGALKANVLVLEKRPHPGGNSFSESEPETGIECHRHGSHIFHTNNEKVWRYLRRFTDFNAYRHRVLTEYRGQIWPMPIGLMTLNRFYGLNLKPWQVSDFMARESARENTAPSDNLEAKAIRLVGRPLYEAFIKGYTQKQWGRAPKDLPPEIISRLPVRKNYNDDYFNALWQGIPLHGYGKLFKKMLDHENITVRYNTEFKHIKNTLPHDCTIIYTGMIDELFDYKYGFLEWRSLRFETEILPYQDFQGTSVINFSDVEVPYTRIHEFKHYHPERKAVWEQPRTVICREYPAAWRPGEEAYYPVDNEKNRALFNLYQRDAANLGNMMIGGRLGSYRYWDMDQAVAAALDLSERLAEGSGTK